MHLFSKSLTHLLFQVEAFVAHLRLEDTLAGRQILPFLFGTLHCVFLRSLFPTQEMRLTSKAPLLKSMQALNKSAQRLLKHLNKPSKRVTIAIGWEQEFFLIDRELYKARPDIIMSGSNSIWKCACPGAANY